MEMKRKFFIGLILGILILNIGTAFAADQADPFGQNAISQPSSGTGGLKLSTTTFTQGASWQQLDALKPLAALIIICFLFVYGLSLFLNFLGSGIKINASSFTKNNDLRKDGQSGYIHGVGGLLIMCFATIAVLVLWNNFGPGTW